MYPLMQETRMLPQSKQDTDNREDLKLIPIHTSVIYQILRIH